MTQFLIRLSEDSCYFTRAYRWTKLSQSFYITRSKHFKEFVNFEITQRLIRERNFLLLQLSVLLHFSKLDTHLLSFKKNECSMNCMLLDHTLSFFGWFICFGKWTKRSLLYDCRWKVLIFFLSLFENVLRKRFQKKATDTKVILATKQIKQYWSFFRGFSV